VLFGATIETRDFGGYEIHVGVSKATRACRHFATLRRNGGDLVQDGAVSADGFTVGTYVHGLFDYDVFRHELIDALRKSCGLLPARTRVDFTAARDVRIERLARIVGENIDVDAMLA
jgi:adenosylcobyric acid synthase